MKKLIITYFSILLAAAGAERGYVTDYDFTTPATVKLFDAAGAVELRVLPERMVYNHLYGSYAGLFDYTGGFLLNIYPDGVVVLYEFADIWQGAVIGRGHWKYNEGRVLITWSALKFDGMMPKDFFDKKYGVTSELLMFVSAKDESLKDTILVSADKLQSVVDSFYIQRQKYVDWSKQRDELLRRSEKNEK